jgi:hypothetical protein
MRRVAMPVKVAQGPLHWLSQMTWPKPKPIDYELAREEMGGKKLK